MIASFFQLLESRPVEYLLISGQATILYGAASFSEDVDIWLEPSRENVDRFVDVLRASHARYYKLTPPLTSPFLERGHGFHFVLPGAPEVYLDVMGKVPRVSSFADAARRARYFDTEFGRIHTVGIRDLVEIKKTQRPEDYPIIGRLALAEVRAGRDPSAADLVWALDNIFSLRELEDLLASRAARIAALDPPPDAPVLRAAREVMVGREVDEEMEDDLDRWFESRASPLRRADRRYWAAIIEELRQARREGRLMQEGTLV